MKRFFPLAAALMFLVCSGCGDSHESLTADSISTMKEMNSVLDGVKDEASASSAKSKLKSLMEKLNGINERQTKLPAPTQDEIKKMDTKYGKEMDEVQQKFVGHMLRIAMDPKLRGQLDDIGDQMRKTKG